MRVKQCQRKELSAKTAGRECVVHGTLLKGAAIMWTTGRKFTFKFLRSKNVYKKKKTIYNNGGRI